jgi:hypothetical protein
MLFFPFTTHTFALGMWANADAASRVSDAAAYYSGIGAIWDAFWVVLVLASWPVLRRSYFLDRIAPRDAFWRWAGGRVPASAASPAGCSGPRPPPVRLRRQLGRPHRVRAGHLP